MTITVHVKVSNGNKFTVDVDLELTVADLKALLVEKSSIAAEQQRLIYKGRVLKNESTLQSYGLENDHTIHLVRGAPPPGQQPAPSPSPQAASPAPPSGAGAGLGFGASPMGLGLGGLGGMGAYPDLQQAQAQLLQNPQMMRDMLNSPLMQGFMDNPQLMRQLLLSNPQMREVLDRNPELNHVLNDPAVLRQSIEAARNPEIMREMMRHTDRAMSNIEAMPEGFNMLRRMYETVQEPLMDAGAAGGAGGAGAGGDLAGNPFAALFGGGAPPAATPSAAAGGGAPAAAAPNPNTAPLPNPWGPPAAPVARAADGGAAATAGAGTRGVDAGAMPPGAGLGPLGLGLGNLRGGADFPPPLLELMQTPMVSQAVQQIMQQAFQDPQFMEQMLSRNPNPQVRSMLQSNPQMVEMMRGFMSNPDFVRQMSSPEAMQFMMQQMQSGGQGLAGMGLGDLSFLGAGAAAAGGAAPGAAGAGTGTPVAGAGGAAPGAAPAGGVPNMDALLGMLGMMGTGPQASMVPPAERFATQLRQLQDMGFYDEQTNLEALAATNGNVNAAVERLLQG